ncbi:hypothetical protein BDV93DRAFT_515587 [Ceratobasidium sp. AG-I]|nr:hypothetical protein BDV93DRAFT_515587 [Ceratobasidium sp. AG-I]
MPSITVKSYPQQNPALLQSAPECSGAQGVQGATPPNPEPSGAQDVVSGALWSSNEHKTSAPGQISGPSPLLSSPQVHSANTPIKLHPGLCRALKVIPKYSSAQLHALNHGEELPIPTTPASDPEWTIGKAMTVRGTLFQTRATLINVSITIPAGSTLAIGTLSPALIILESEDEQTLDLFSTPNSIRLRLIQEVYIGTDNDRHSSHNTFTTSLGRARVWPTSHVRHSLPPHTRLVEAELIIPRGTRPSFEFSRFEVKYRIQLTFDPPGFTWNDAASLPSGVTKPTLERDVTLVSDPGSSIAWKSRVPQACAGQDLRDEDFYDGQNITGVLLGAGQKYLEHHHG